MEARPGARDRRLTSITLGLRNFPATSLNHHRMVTVGPAEPADGELIRRTLAGERDAFEAIYRRYHAVVYRFARMMSGSSSVAEDVTQEVFVALMRDVARYEPQRAGLATYLYGVARNVTRARLRKEERFVDLEDASNETSQAASSGDPSEALVRSQNLMRLRRAIVALPSRYREVVILCDIHDLSYAEAAAVLGSPVGTVRSRLHRARNLLARRFRSDEHAPSSRSVPRTVAGCLA